MSLESLIAVYKCSCALYLGSRLAMEVCTITQLNWEGYERIKKGDQDYKKAPSLKLYGSVLTVGVIAFLPVVNTIAALTTYTIGIFKSKVIVDRLCNRYIKEGKVHKTENVTTTTGETAETRIVETRELDCKESEKSIVVGEECRETAAEQLDKGILRTPENNYEQYFGASAVEPKFDSYDSSTLEQCHVKKLGSMPGTKI